jgi:hypothetical protein
MITIDVFVYTLCAVGFFVGILYDLFDSYPGGLVSSGKVKGELSLRGVVILVCWIVFTVMWGGVFWW